MKLGHFISRADTGTALWNVSHSDRDEFLIAGCRVSLRGAFVRVEPIATTSNPQAVADEYVAALRERVGGLLRVLTVDEFSRMPPRQVFIRRSEQRARAVPRRDYWSREVVPALRQVPMNVWERESGGKSRRILIDARHGRRRPHRRNQELLIAVARKLGVLN